MTCPEKKVIVNVGHILSDPKETAVAANYPEDIRSWIVTVEETIPTKEEWSFTAVATCVSIP